MKDKKKKKCSFCEVRKKLKENVRDSYARQGSIESYLKEMTFANTKPFKVNFKEGLSVSFKNYDLTEETLKKKMTPAEIKKKKETLSNNKKHNGKNKLAVKMAKLKSKKK